MSKMFSIKISLTIMMIFIIYSSNAKPIQDETKNLVKRNTDLNKPLSSISNGFSFEEFDKLSNLFIKYFIIYKDKQLNAHQRKIIFDYLNILIKELRKYLNTTDDEQFLADLINSITNGQNDSTQKLSRGPQTFKWGK
jgi:hypothetical protein